MTFSKTKKVKRVVKATMVGQYCEIETYCYATDLTQNYYAVKITFATVNPVRLSVPNMCRAKEVFFAIEHNCI